MMVPWAVSEVLIANGADVNAKMHDGKTPLDVAHEKAITDLLRKHGGKHSSIHEAADGGVAEDVKGFLAAGADVNAKDRYGVTPLHYAISDYLKETAELLIAEGVDVNAKSNSGETPLDTAIRVHKTQDRTPIMDLLRKHGAKTSKELEDAGWRDL